jgi:putative lipoic acid-binding regulatory protein
MEQRDISLDALRQAHAFPGPYKFKIIGANSAEFLASVLQVAVVFLGPHPAPEVAVRQSTGGNHQAITLTVQVSAPEVVLDIYRALQGLAGVRFLL